MISLRRFKTSRSSRSAKYRQVVLPLFFDDYREVAIRVVRSRKGAKQSDFFKQAVSPAFIMMAAGVVGVFAFGWQLLAVPALTAKSYSTVLPAKAYVIKPLPKSIPTHIKIPSVGIDYDMISVGKASDGSIQMPPLFDWVTGWYQYSPTPGQIGPAIIVGHVDTYKGISVFWRLRDVQKGDLIYISRSDGKTAVFKVSALKMFSQADFPTQEVYGNISYPGVRLITCGGPFDTSTGSYTENTVVYGFMINQKS